MENTIGQRIRQLRKAKKLTVAEFAKAAGVKPSAIYGLESDANKPSVGTVATLRLAFPDLNTEWLQFGTGQMYVRSFLPRAPEQEEPMLPTTETPAAPTPGLTSGAATVAEAENILLRAENERQQKEIERLWELLGKSPGNPDAAGNPFPTNPRYPSIGFQTNAQREEAANDFDAYVAVRLLVREALAAGLPQ